MTTRNKPARVNQLKQLQLKLADYSSELNLSNETLEFKKERTIVNFNSKPYAVEELKLTQEQTNYRVLNYSYNTLMTNLSGLAANVKQKLECVLLFVLLELS